MENTVDLVVFIRVLMVAATVFIALISAVIAVYVRNHFVPKMIIEIESRFIPENNIIILKLSMESICNVYLPKESIRLQILEHKFPEGNSLSEWVPFSKKEVEPGEEPIEWVEPIEIFTSTTGLQPNEKLTVERFYKASENADLVHIGFQYLTKLSRIVSWLVPKPFSPYEQWTTTAFVLKESSVES